MKNFFFVGGLNTLFSYTLYLSMISVFGDHYYLVVWGTSTIITSFLSFVLYKNIVFKEQGKSLRRYLSFISKDVLFYFIKIGILSYLVEWGGFSVVLAPVMIMIIQFLFTFFYLKRIVFS